MIIIIAFYMAKIITREGIQQVTVRFQICLSSLQKKDVPFHLSMSKSKLIDPPQSLDSYAVLFFESTEGGDYFI